MGAAEPFPIALNRALFLNPKFVHLTPEVGCKKFDRSGATYLVGINMQICTEAQLTISDLYLPSLPIGQTPTC
jgi:hypothetical protein